MIESIAIGLGLALIIIGAIGAMAAGIRNVINGKSDLKKMSIVIIPLLIFGISYVLTNSFDQAGMATFLIMMGLMALAIIVSSTKRTFNL